MMASEQIAPEVVARMEALVRRLVARETWNGTGFTDPLENEAREIVALLPEPVDPVVLACREICRSMFSGSEWIAGDYDEGDIMRVALAAYRAGQEAGK